MKYLGKIFNNAPALSFCILDLGSSDSTLEKIVLGLSDFVSVVVYGIDQDSKNSMVSKARPGKDICYVPIRKFIGNGNAMSFKHYPNPRTSSFFAWNDGFMSLFTNLLLGSPRVELVSTSKIDDLSEIKTIDFLKMDIQGGELLALQGASRSLKSVLAVGSEVLFNSCYSGAPVFSEIDLELRKQGFIFHKFGDFFSRSLKGSHAKLQKFSSFQLWCYEAYWVRDIVESNLMSIDQLIKSVLISEFFLCSPDLTAFYLGHLESKLNIDLLPLFIEDLNLRNA